MSNVHVRAPALTANKQCACVEVNSTSTSGSLTDTDAVVKGEVASAL